MGRASPPGEAQGQPLLGLIDTLPYCAASGSPPWELFAGDAFDPQDAPPAAHNYWG